MLCGLFINVVIPIFNKHGTEFILRAAKGNNSAIKNGGERRRSKDEDEGRNYRRMSDYDENDRI